LITANPDTCYSVTGIFVIDGVIPLQIAVEKALQLDQT
jgi:hypothetical protein